MRKLANSVIFLILLYSSFFVDEKEALTCFECDGRLCGQQRECTQNSGDSPREYGGDQRGYPHSRIGDSSSKTQGCLAFTVKGEDGELVYGKKCLPPESDTNHYSNLSEYCKPYGGVGGDSTSGTGCYVCTEDLCNGRDGKANKITSSFLIFVVSWFLIFF